MKIDNTAFEKLQDIFKENKDKRILVVGASCIGKSTIINQLGLGIDMDEFVRKNMSQDEKELLNSLDKGEGLRDNSNWMVFWKGCVATHMPKCKIRTGEPLFVVLTDYFIAPECDLIVLLDASIETSTCLFYNIGNH